MIVASIAITIAFGIALYAFVAGAYQFMDE
jgi:hypothetical protein